MESKVIVHISEGKTGVNSIRTACGRVISRGSKRMYAPAESARINCGECLENTHKNKAFEMTRIDVDTDAKLAAKHAVQAAEKVIKISLMSGADRKRMGKDTK